MSIASEITRLQGVKSDILQAISDKGVTVPVGSALDDCPLLISYITAIKDYSKIQLENFDSDADIKLNGLTLSSNNVSSIRLCQTPLIYFSQANSIKIHYEYAVKGYSQNGYSSGFGEPITNNEDIRGLVSVFVSSTILRISYGNPIVNVDIPIAYTLEDRIKVDIDIDKLNSRCDVKVYYSNNLVAHETIPIGSIVISDYRLSVGGLRVDTYHGYAINGDLYLDSSYIKLDDVLVWGADCNE